MKSDNGYIREQVYKRDEGFCSVCKLDCQQVFVFLEAVRKKSFALYQERRDQLGVGDYEPGRSYWFVDHIKPVWKGGGECGIENLATLCCKCHKAKTKREAGERARRKATKKAFLK